MLDGKKSPPRGNVAGFSCEVRVARKRVLLRLHDRLAGVPGLADLLAGDVVAALELVEDERVELRRIDLAVVGQHGLVRDDIGDLADDAVHRLGRYDLRKTAFHRDGELVDNRRVDVLRLRGRAASALELVGRLVSRGNAEVVRDVHVRLVRDGDGERL